MSNLQLGLTVLGGLLLVGLVIYNAWQAHKSTPRQAEEGRAAGVPSRHPPSDGAFLHTGAGDSTLSDGTRAPLKKAGLDAHIDAMAHLHLSSDVSGDAILAAMPGSRRVGSKPFAIEALHRSTREWESPRPAQRYGAVRLGVQRANRHGALNEIEFSEFATKVNALAAALKAAVELPDAREEVSRARELDQFASANDAQLGFTLRALKAPWTPGYVQQQASAQGFLSGNLPGRMVLLPPGHSTALLTLAFDTQAVFAEYPGQAALRDVSVLLDVAHVARDAQPYAHMLNVVRALSQSMDAAITDDAGRTLDEPTLASIGFELEKMYEALEARGLPAGSALARRLFS